MIFFCYIRAMKQLSDKTKSALIEFLRALLASLVALLTALLASGCGTTTRAVVTNNRENTSTTISITTSNSTTTDVNASPDVQILPKN